MMNNWIFVYKEIICNFFKTRITLKNKSINFFYISFKYELLKPGCFQI